jgi:hypothetical protein
MNSSLFSPIKFDPPRTGWTRMHKKNGMDSILKKNLDRINRIYRISFDRFPEENGQTLSPAAK